MSRPPIRTPRHIPTRTPRALHRTPTGPAIATLASPALAPITLSPAPALKTQYPHVEGITDWRAQQSIRLLWDRSFDLEARLQAATATIEDLAARTNHQDLQLASVQRAAGEALAVALAAAADAGDGGSSGPSSSDGGEGLSGCGSATGAHLTLPALTVGNAGQIICGVGIEFASLLAAVGSLAIREANRLTLISRCIWHLQQAGFTAGRAAASTGALNPWMLTVNATLSTDTGGAPSLFAYQIFEFQPHTSLLHMTMTYLDASVSGISLVTDAGTPD